LIEILNTENIDEFYSFFSFLVLTQEQNILEIFSLENTQDRSLTDGDSEVNGQSERYDLKNCKTYQPKKSSFQVFFSN